VTAERDSPPNQEAFGKEAEHFVTATRDWLEKAVIGLGLCPFAEHVYRGGQLHFKVSGETSTSGLVKDLVAELQRLHAADPAVLETTLLIHPHVLGNFDDYNQFLDDADATVRALGFEGELQVASFHPAYQFAGSGADDVANCTNRSPYQMLHLLREASVTRAVECFPGVHEIGDRNAATLSALGHAGWRRLWTHE
jgi:hypothetical protein